MAQLLIRLNLHHAKYAAPQQAAGMRHFDHFYSSWLPWKRRVFALYVNPIDTLVGRQRYEVR